MLPFTGKTVGPSKFLGMGKEYFTKRPSILQPTGYANNVKFLDERNVGDVCHWQRIPQQKSWSPGLLGTGWKPSDSQENIAWQHQEVLRG